MREELMYGCLRTIENDDLRILAGEMIKTSLWNKVCK